VETLCELCHQQDGQQVPEEVALLRRVAHVPGVLRLVDYFRRPDGYVLVLDRPDRSEDLFDYITRRGALDDAEARSVFRRVVETLCQVLVMRAPLDVYSCTRDNYRFNDYRLNVWHFSIN